MTQGAQLQGATIGSYVVRHEIGNGGMGAVYLVEHKMLGRRAALKMLHPEMSANQDMVQRFFNEARAASAIKSPGIVEIYDFGYHVDHRAYIVMELLEGESLSMRLRRLRALPVLQALTIARQIASALGPAHRAGIVHRDLKPDNVFLVPDGEAASGERTKILDFGIAKLSGGDGLSSGMQATSTKMVMGSPHYMSPEQCRGAGVVDLRSDLYALGCILFECLTGRPPFVGEGFGELMGAHLHVPPPPLGSFVPGMPPEVEALVQRLLAKQPAARPQSAEETAAVLNELIAQLRSTSVVAQLQPQAATLHMAPGSYPPGPGPGTGPGSMRPPTPAPMLPPQQAGSGLYPGHGAGSHPPGGGYPGQQAVSYPGQPAPTTMRHSSGSATTPPQQRSGGRTVALVGGTVAAIAAGVVVIVLMSSKKSETVAELTPAVDAAPVDPPPKPVADAAPVATPPTNPATPPTDPATTPPADPTQPPADPATPPADAKPDTKTDAKTDAKSDAKTAEPAKDVTKDPRKDSKDPAKDKKDKRDKKDLVKEPVVPEAAPSLPKTLTAQMQDAGYDSVYGKIMRCANEKQGGSGTVFVTVEVMPSGKVKQTLITNSNNNALSGCVSANLIHAKFEPTLEGGKFRKIIQY